MVNNFFKNLYNKWLKRRLPVTKEITLNSGNTFIFPSKLGLHFLLCCFLLFILGTNYQNNLILFLVFFLCSFMVTCLLLSYQNLAGLTLNAIEPEAQFSCCDCQFKLRVNLSNTTATDIYFCFQTNSSQLKSIISNDIVELYSYSILRGYFDPGRVTVRSNFPFGLFNVWTHLDFGFNALLYPQPLENKFQATSLSDNVHENSHDQSLLGVDQFSSLKNYQQGESLRSVAWKQLAQGRGWLTKQFEQSAGGDILLDINNLTHLPVETRLSFLCYQIIELQKNNQRYTLILNNETINVGSGYRHKEHCLKALALFDGAVTQTNSSSVKLAGQK
jgi:uncharacterized protein (DUF58 family)